MGKIWTWLTRDTVIILVSSQPYLSTLASSRLSIASSLPRNGPLRKDWSLLFTTWGHGQAMSSSQDRSLIVWDDDTPLSLELLWHVLAPQLWLAHMARMRTLWWLLEELFLDLETPWSQQPFHCIKGLWTMPQCESKINQVASEIAPAKKRGGLVVMNHIGMVTGLAAAFW